MYNQEIYQLYQSPDIIVTTKGARLQQAGHLQITHSNEIPSAIMDPKL
jgi:hypothetical protein